MSTQDVVKAARELLEAMDRTEFFDLGAAHPIPRTLLPETGLKDDEPLDGGMFAPLTAGHVRRLREALAKPAYLYPDDMPLDDFVAALPSLPRIRARLINGVSWARANEHLGWTAARTVGEVRAYDLHQPSLWFSRLPHVGRDTAKWVKQHLYATADEGEP